MDYSQLSDFEINKRVSDVFWPDINKSPECNNKTFPQNSSVVYMDNGYGGFSRDYCNKSVDAWPLIVRHKLSLINADGDWLCVPDNTVVDGVTGDDVRMIYSSGGYVHSNPLRAAMIVFLMTQDKS